MKIKYYFLVFKIEKKFIATFSNIVELSWQTNTSQNLNISIFRHN